MEKLEKMIRPTIGLLTNIGEAHSEGFADAAHKEKEKRILFAYRLLIVINFVVGYKFRTLLQLRQ